MSFHGCVESISQTRITGWAHFLVDGKPAPVGLTLRFWNAGSVAPTSTHVRGDGVIGFVFELGAQYQSFTWAKFIDEFRAIEATFETDLGVQRWDVPLFISILKPYDNRTALVGKLRDYNLAPKPDGRIACFTMVYNEYAMLPLWARYYAKVFGAENLYVLDHGSDKPYEDLPEGITVISLPRDQFGNWLIARIVGFFQRFLLESYDSVLYTDSDELVCASPETLGGKALAEFLLGLDPPIADLAGHAIEIDQRYLSVDPDGVAIALRNCLNITETEAKRLGQALGNDRPERSWDLTERPADLAAMQWGSAEVDEFNLTCLK